MRPGSLTIAFLLFAVSSTCAWSETPSPCDVYKGKLVAWGDIHSHTTFSNDALEQNGCTIEPGEACAKARDEAELQFMAITDHTEAGQPGVYTQVKWEEMLRQEQALDEEHPSAARPLWRIGNGAWHESGETEQIETGRRLVTFNDVPGWNTPAKVAIDVLDGQTHELTGEYVYSYLRPEIVPAKIAEAFDDGAKPPQDTYGYIRVTMTPTSLFEGPKIIVFPGIEFTKGTTDGTVAEGNGHKNMIFRDFPSAPAYGGGFGSDVFGLPVELWSYLNTANAEYISIPHHPAKTEDEEVKRFNVATDWSAAYVDGAIQPLVELYSRHGSSEVELGSPQQDMDDEIEQVNGFDGTRAVEATLQEWLKDPKPDSGYKLGVIGGTDTHDGNPGAVAEIPGNVDDRLSGRFTGGLAAVWASAVDRDDIWTGLTGRNCYATSGSRTLLEFAAGLGDQTVPMGATLTHTGAFSAEAAGTVSLHVRAVADKDLLITRIQIFSNGAVIADESDPAWSSDVHRDYQVECETDFAYYRVKVWQSKSSNPIDGNVPYERAWSSPIWVEKVASAEGEPPVEGTPPTEGQSPEEGEAVAEGELLEGQAPAEGQIPAEGQVIEGESAPEGQPAAQTPAEGESVPADTEQPVEENGCFGG